MWSEAIELFERAQRMSRRAFQPLSPEARQPCWEPPVDMFETADEVVLFTALPGVDPASVTTVIDDGALVIRGRRSLPPELQTAAIHRLELPQGCFYRRVDIPPGLYGEVRRASWNGCVVVTLSKQQPSR
jgi:HSP20 family molecular chaperone IbpA